MKFIEVNPGYSIRLTNVDSVMSIDGMSCSITSGGQIFKVGVPYRTMMDILNTDNADNQIRLLQEINKKVGNLPVFAG